MTNMMNEQLYASRQDIADACVEQLECELRNELVKKAENRQINLMPNPRLIVLQLNPDKPAEMYAKRLYSLGRRYHIDVMKITTSTQEQLLETLHALSKEAINFDSTSSIEPKAFSVLLQTPLDVSMEAASQIAQELNHVNEIDGMSASSMTARSFLSLGILRSKPNQLRHFPCTAEVCHHLLDSIGERVIEYAPDMPLESKETSQWAGAYCEIIGRSRALGLPLARLALINDMSIQVTHRASTTKASTLQNADVLFATSGVANWLDAQLVNPEALIFDIGMGKSSYGKYTGNLDARCGISDDQMYISPHRIGELTTLTALTRV